MEAELADNFRASQAESDQERAELDRVAAIAPPSGGATPTDVIESVSTAHPPPDAIEPVTPSPPQRSYADAAMPELVYTEVPPSAATAAGVVGTRLPLLPRGVDASKYADVATFVAVAQYDWRSRAALIQNECSHVKMAMLCAQRVTMVRVPGCKPLLFITGVSAQIQQQTQVSIVEVATEELQLDGADATQLVGTVIVQGTRDEVRAALRDVCEQAIIGSRKGQPIVEATGVPKPSFTGIPSMPLAVFLEASAAPTWATIRLPATSGTVYDRLVFARVLLRDIPGARLRVSGLVIRAYLSEGWTLALKQKVQALGVRSVFIEGTVRSEKAGTSETLEARVSAIRTEEDSISAERQQVINVVSAARAKGEDVRALRAEASSDSIMDKLRAVAAKIGTVLFSFPRAACVVVSVTLPTCPQGDIVRVGAFGLLKSPLPRC